MYGSLKYSLKWTVNGPYRTKRSIQLKIASYVSKKRFPRSIKHGRSYCSVILEKVGGSKGSKYKVHQLQNFKIFHFHK